MSEFNQDIILDNPIDKTNDNQVLFLYTQLLNLPFSNIETIIRLERSLYIEHNNNPHDKLAVMGLLQAQIMLGNKEKAQSFAYLLWDEGAMLDATEESFYINNLIDLGLLDMAGEILKPRLENLSQNIKNFFPVMVKFSIMTGNMYLLERLLMNPQVPYQNMDFKQLIAQYKSDKKFEYLKNVMKIMQNELKNNLCSCECNLAETLEIYMYLRQDKSEIEETEKQLQERLNFYYQSIGIDEIPNFSWSLQPIWQHPAMELD